MNKINRTKPVKIIYVFCFYFLGDFNDLKILTGLFRHSFKLRRSLQSWIVKNINLFYYQFIPSNSFHKMIPKPNITWRQLNYSLYQEIVLTWSSEGRKRLKNFVSYSHLQSKQIKDFFLSMRSAIKKLLS